MNSTIAFIGLGVMGSPMAQNLVKHNFTVQGWNRTQTDRPLLEQARDRGVTIKSTIKEAVTGADFICICVGDGQDVQEVIFGAGGIADHAKTQATIIDFSTIGPTVTREIHERLTAPKLNLLNFMDAPISGGDVGAQQGTLTIMVGGNHQDYQNCLPIFEALGKNIIHCGAIGAGQAVKLCNQLLCVANMIGLCEATQLAHGFNLDPELMIEVCSTGAAGSWALSNLGPKLAHGDYAPGFMVKHILKDLRLVQENIDGLNFPGTILGDRLFKIVEQLGGAEQGTQAMMRAYLEKE